ncbi:MAG: 3-deoxy-D-manno-octulosonic acid transferase, partial [Bacteroidia bacterium]|nr:3-deoxy-D-manno-octulosonic acid transferase [Bacteroidia bacterium]
VGGAIGTTGLHNILEPAVFGVPIIIGKNHSKFPEAKLLIDNGGVFAINNEAEFESLLERFVSNKEFRKQSGELNASYIKKNKGAVVQIADYIRR